MNVGRFWYAIAVQNDLATSVRRAAIDDADSVAELVNRAYAIESFFVDGQRTSADEICELMERGDFIVLEHSGGLAAAVYLEFPSESDPLVARFERATYFGMLSVDPAFQRHGLGTRLVRIVEALSEAAGRQVVSLRVINLREELGRWYRSLGYVECGTSPYERRPVKQPCHFIEMRKLLRPATALAPAAAA